MAVVTRLTDDEVRAVAEKILGREWATFGFERAEVTSGEDHDGNASIFITALLKAQVPVIAGRAFAHAHHVLDEELRATGEDRFPYLWVSREDDEIPEGSSPVDLQ